MANEYSTKLTGRVLAVIVALLLTAVIMVPIINSVQGEDTTQIVTKTAHNNGASWKSANFDDASHSIEIGLNGEVFTVKSDNVAYNTGIGDYIGPQVAPGYSPFNTYYAAVNLSSGSNADDSGETRLSTEKGEIAYILNPDNLKQTKAGYTFDPTLYNVMLVIPPVYWYSELDSGSSTTGKLYIASSPDAFVSLGVTADKMKDYAHTYTSGGQTGHSPAIMIGVYESYKTGGNILISQSDRTPSGNISLTSAMQMARNGNSDVTFGTYEVWNFYMWTLYKIMGITVMGNMDSQYMMGNGNTSTSINTTGLTSSAFTKSESSNASSSLFIENSWGGLIEWIGDATNDNGTLIADNKLGGSDVQSNVTNTLTNSVTLSNESGYINTFNPISDVFGFGATGQVSADSPGQGINDEILISTSNNAIAVGGRTGNEAGMFAINIGNNWGTSANPIGTRLAYVVTSENYVDQTANNSPFAYILSYDVDGTVSDVKVSQNGQMVSKMPTGTTLNSYWDWVDSAITTYGPGDDGVTYVPLAVGDSAIVQLYTSGDVWIHNNNTHISLGKLTSGESITFTIQSGTMSYTDDSENAGTVSVSAFIGADGDMRWATAPASVLGDSTIIVFANDYPDGGYVAHGDTEGMTATAIESASVITSTPVFTEGEYYDTLTEVTMGIDGTDSSVTKFLVPYEIEWNEEIVIKGNGMAADLLVLVPIIIVLAIILYVGRDMIFNKG